MQTGSHLRAPGIVMEALNPSLSKDESLYSKLSGAFFRSKEAILKSNISNEFGSIHAEIEVSYFLHSFIKF